MTNLFNELVRTLLGVRPTNIVNNYNDDTKEEEMKKEWNPAQDAFELGRFDLNNSKYKWFLDRGIGLDTLTKETQIEAKIKELEEHRSYCRTMLVELEDGRKVRNDSMKAKMAWDKGFALKEMVEHMVKKLDESFGAIEDSQVFDDKRTVGEVLVEYVRDLTDSMRLKSNMDLGKLAVGVDVVQEMFSQKEILFEEYRQAMVMLVGVLAHNTEDYEVPRHNIYSVTYTTIHNPEWNNLFERVMGFDEPSPPSMSFDDRLFGQMAIDMEETIDLLQEVRDLTRISYGSQCPLLMRTIYDGLVEERDNSLEGREEDLPQEEIDLMVNAFAMR
jgi:hypothetical protein